MKFLICVLLLCLVALTGVLAYQPIQSDNYDTAACGRGIFGVRGRIQDRRAAGEGLFQKNGPMRRAFGLRGC